MANTNNYSNYMTRLDDGVILIAPFIAFPSAS